MEFGDSPDRYNVVWDSPSQDQHGSVPLGNGSTGLNAWIEPSGDLVFYVSRTDSWGDNGRLLKVGKVRISLDPAPSTDDFLQTLSLADGTLKARCGETEIRLWVDANRSVIHAEFNGPNATDATAAIESWRTEPYTLPSLEASDMNPGNRSGEPTIVEPDTFLQNQDGRVGWYHHNHKSFGPAMHAKIQGVDGFKRQDPLLHRTFGAVIKAEGARRVDDTHLLSPRSKHHRFDITVHAEHPVTEAKWLTAIESAIAETEAIDFEKRHAAHEAWWRAFWQRSWIHVTPGSGGATAKSLIPANSLNFRFGVDPNGGNKLTGQLGRATLLARALVDNEIRELAGSRADQAGPKGDVLFGGTPSLHSEIKDSAGWTDSPAISAELWIQAAPNAGSVRILDKTMPGSNEGLLLDTHPGNSLRLIVGDRVLMVPDCLQADQWHHVAAVVDAGSHRIELYLDGKQVAGQPAAQEDDAFVVSRAYALQRYVNACGGRGALPIKFNGAIFTVAHDGYKGKPTPGDADYRRWGPGYWWQNTRLPYISMCTSGDIEMTEPLYQMYCRDMFEYHKYRTQKHTGHAGIFVPECISFWGDMFPQVYGWKPYAERDDKLQDNPYHKWEWVSGPELCFMMLDRYDHTLDEAFLKDTVIPFAHEVLRFFDLQYETGPDGKLVMHPSMALETWWECTNPMPEVAGLHAVTDRLLALPENLTDPEMRTYWAEVKTKIPDLPTQKVDGKTFFAPAEKFANCRNSEIPELYSVFPFRLCSFEKDNVELGREAYRQPGPRGNNGWRQDEIFLAYLGLADQAQEKLVGRARNTHKESRFPGFFGPNMDWTPDQTHGGVLLKALQAMILQTEGKKIFIAPAWPKDWNAEFKLHAPYKTVVEGKVENGELVDLKVTPESRRADVVSAMVETYRVPSKPVDTSR